MKKILIVIGMLCLVMYGVYALTIGNNISQEQLDGLDLSNLDLSNGFLREGGNVVYNCTNYNFVKYCMFYANFTTVEPNYNENGILVDYATMYHIEEFGVKAKKYVDMKTQTSLSYARQQLKNNLQSRYNKFDENNKLKIAKYQTQPSYDMEDIVSGIDLE